MIIKILVLISSVHYSQGIVDVNNDPDKRFYAPTTVQVWSCLARCSIPTGGKLKRLIIMCTFNFILIVYFMTLSIVQGLCALG